MRVHRNSSLRQLLIPFLIALIPAAIFSIRYIHVFPFSNDVQERSYEAIGYWGNYLEFAKEPFSFPLGKIKGLTYPFQDANVGNSAVIATFGIPFKLLGKIFPIFQTVFYFNLIEILSVFFSAFFSIRILKFFNITDRIFLLLTGLLIGLSPALLFKSHGPVPPVIFGYALLVGWGYYWLVYLTRPFTIRIALPALLIFPITALTDNYALFSQLMLTGFLFLIFLADAVIGQLREAWYRVIKTAIMIPVAIAASLFSLFLIGMFPLPRVPGYFTTFDHGMGGRYHGADLFSVFTPHGFDPKSGIFTFNSIPSFLGFPVNTSIWESGQYEGVAYLGTAAILLFLIACLGARKSSLIKGTSLSFRSFNLPISIVISFFISTLLLYVLSWGYALRVFGHELKFLPLSPAGLLAEIHDLIKNFRGMGRLSYPFSVVLILSSLGIVYKKYFIFWKNGRKITFFIVVVGLLLIESYPFIKPLHAAVPKPLIEFFNSAESNEIRKIISNRLAVFIPCDFENDNSMSEFSFAISYISEPPISFSYIARTVESHEYKRTLDNNRLLSGGFVEHFEEYPNSVVVMRDYYVNDSNKLIALKGKKIKDAYFLTEDMLLK